MDNFSLRKASAFLKTTIQQAEPKTLWRALEIVGLVLAFVAIYLALESNKLARDGLNQAISENQRNQLLQAWAVLAQASPGNSGKVEALQTLAARKVQIIGLDLSCETMGGGWNPAPNLKASQKCKRPTFLKDLKLPRQQLMQLNFTGSNLSFSDFSGTRLSQIDFDASDISAAKFNSAIGHKVSFTQAKLALTEFVAVSFSKSTFQGVVARSVDFSSANLAYNEMTDARLENAKFANTVLTGVQFQRTQFRNPDFTNAKLVLANFVSSSFVQPNFSGTVFCEQSECVNGLTQESLKTAWAWNDRAPQLPNELKLALVCDSALRPEYEKTQKFGIPKGCE